MRQMPRATRHDGRADLLHAAPAASGARRARRPRHMRLFVSGSAPLLAETHRDLRERTGHAILERYGMTETNMNTSNPYDGRAASPARSASRCPASTLAHRRARDRQRRSPPGEIGMIEVKGPNVFRAIGACPRRRGPSSATTASSSPATSGTIDERGYVHIVGRGKDLDHHRRLQRLPEGGRRPRSTPSPGVVESAVIGVPHPDFGEGVTAVVVPARGRRARRRRECIAALADRLATLQAAEAGGLRRRPAAQRHGQGAEEPAARGP